MDFDGESWSRQCKNGNDRKQRDQYKGGKKKERNAKTVTDRREGANKRSKKEWELFPAVAQIREDFSLLFIENFLLNISCDFNW